MKNAKRPRFRNEAIYELYRRVKKLTGMDSVSAAKLFGCGRQYIYDCANTCNLPLELYKSVREAQIVPDEEIDRAIKQNIVMRLKNECDKCGLPYNKVAQVVVEYMDV